jgi:hypothetical protein
MTGVDQLVAGRYRVVRPLAAGGLSRVWLAVDQTLDRPVAIKQCAPPAGLTEDEKDLLRSWAFQEALASARVRHPTVVRVLDVLPDPDQPWIVMEYVPSRSLRQVVAEAGPLPPAEVASIGLTLLAGLTASVRVGVLHLDVKPGNVLVATDGRVLLSDPGPVVTEPGLRALTAAGIILGSANYIAPERLFEGVSTARADLWSLGATLYYAVEGRRPYRRPTTAEMMRALADSPPDPVQHAGPLAGVLTGLLQRDPAARMTAAEVERRLTRVAAAKPRPGVRDRLRGARPAPPRNTAPAVASSAVAPSALAPAAAAVARPGPAGQSRPRRWPVVRRRVAVVTAVAALAGTLATASAGADRDDRLRSAGAPAGLTRPQMYRAAVVLPPGYIWWNDPAGFRVAVPAEWRRTPDGTGTLLFLDPDGGPRLRIRAWVPPRGDVMAGLIAAERSARLPGYRRIRIEARPPAVWEYTYKDAAGRPMRGLQRVTTAAGFTYRIEWQAPRSAWADALPVLDVVLDGFGPLPGA